MTFNKEEWELRMNLREHVFQFSRMLRARVEYQMRHSAPFKYMKEEEANRGYAEYVTLA